MPSSSANAAVVAGASSPAYSGPALDSQAKARLHAQLSALKLPLPRYETIVRTTYTVHIHLPAATRAKLFLLHSQDVDQDAWSSLSSALGLHKARPSKAKAEAGTAEHGEANNGNGEGGEITYTGRPAAQKRDALARCAASLAGLLENWSARRDVQRLKKSEGELQKVVREVERKEKRKGKKREKRNRDLQERRAMLGADGVEAAGE